MARPAWIERRHHFEPRLLERGHVLLLGRAALDDEWGASVRDRGSRAVGPRLRGRFRALRE